MPISLKGIYGGASTPVGGMVLFPDNLPIKITDQGITWLRSQYIETNTDNFDATYWDHTRATLWTKRYEWFNRSFFGASANGNTIVLAVGHNGTDAGGVLVSTDNGITWGSLIVPSGLTGTQSITAVRWVSFLSLWVAVSSNGLIWTSSDTVTWTSRTSGTTNSLNTINFANNTIIIVGASGTILTSTNGTSYTVRTSNVTSNLLSVAFYNNVWMAVGTSAASQSSRSTDNGVTWTAVTVAGNTDNPATTRIFTGNNLFVLCVTGGYGGVFTSTTGLTGSWTQVMANTYSLTGGSYNGDFYIFRDSISNLYKTYELTLTVFRQMTLGTGGNLSISFLNITDGRFLVTGSDSGAGSGRIVTGNHAAYAGSPLYSGSSPTAASTIGTAQYVRIR
jgi:hypothetical protein